MNGISKGIRNFEHPNQGVVTSDINGYCGTINWLLFNLNVIYNASSLGTKMVNTGDVNMIFFQFFVVRELKYIWNKIKVFF